MKIIISHPTGNANVRAVAEGLAKADLLKVFYTSLAAFSGNIWDRLGRFPLLAEFRRRNFNQLLKPYTQQYPLFELGRSIATKLGLQSLLKHESGLFCIDQVYQSLDKYVAKKLTLATKKGTTAMYAYEDGAFESFKKAKKVGIINLYDLPIGYWRAARRLLKTEQMNRPEWAMTLTGFKDSNCKLQRKDDELALADRIFVASSFTAFTLKEYVGELAHIEVIPYGFPSVNKNKEYTYNGNRPLKLLFVGGLSQRKGIANLFEAVIGLENKIELTIVGNKVVDNCEVLNKALSLHTWIPSLPHGEILQLMYEHDVLVFPSLFEGFGLVITEAMSQGTPVITTERTAGPDIITSGENGWIVEAGSTKALRAKIEFLIGNPQQVENAGRAATESARKRPWEVYGKEMAQCIGKILEEKC